MEAIVIVGFFVGLAVLAPRWGQDSRERSAGQSLVGWAAQRRQKRSAAAVNVVELDLALDRARDLIRCGEALRTPPVQSRPWIPSA
jgi:hypothetical protein